MASLRNVRFLVIDDNLHMQQIVKAVLKSFDVQDVITAAGGQQGLSHVRAYKADIIILDIQLERENGLDILRALRAQDDPNIAFLPVIMLTAHSEVHGVQAARDAGANEFCNKPLVPAALYQRIVSVIEKPRPFVRTRSYFGPDRRRHFDRHYKGAERRGVMAQVI